jgi:hypothetical protein
MACTFATKACSKPTSFRELSPTCLLGRRNQADRSYVDVAAGLTGMFSLATPERSVTRHPAAGRAITHRGIDVPSHARSMKPLGGIGDGAGMIRLSRRLRAAVDLERHGQLIQKAAVLRW